MKVLLLEDDKMLTDLMKEMFTLLGHELMVTRDGKEAVAAYVTAYESGHVYDFVLFDLGISGGMGGAHALSEIKKVDQDVVSVACSGNIECDDAKEFLFAVQKPILINQLEVLIDVIEKQQ